MANLVALVLYVLATSTGLVLLRSGTAGEALIRLVDGRLVVNIGLQALVGIALYLVSFLLYVFLISRYSLAYIIPLTTGLVYVLVFGFSFLFLHEKLTLFQVAGIAAILVGLTLLQVR